MKAYVPQLKIKKISLIVKKYQDTKLIQGKKILRGEN